MADDIKSLLALDDAALTAKLGLDTRLASFKEELAEADKMEGKAREHVESRLKEMFSPKVYIDDLKYAVESAERMGKKSSGPCDLVEACGCDVADAEMDD